MREIKFRAYDKISKVMAYTEALSLQSDYHGPYLAADIEDYNFPEPRAAQEVDAIFMEYTGLKDKNNNPIYEADIVRYHDGTTAAVQWNNRLARFDTGELAYESPLFIEPEMVEVVGSVYENPGLLGGQDE